MLIAHEVSRKKGALTKLSTCSRTIRSLVAPVFFARCKAGGRKEAPVAIRCYIRSVVSRSCEPC